MRDKDADALVDAAIAEVGAKPVWGSWVKAQTAKGVPAQELVDAVLAETEKAKKSLGKM